ncbi:hypothetical protein C9374_005172 [Naegleria lovaniensis]|uniref:SAM domain-containing protein n=1 Tax=Naegleria lovaniensis TaxID=51637 RepID=A0AA88KIU4_NAELO|nr:uncharacterized protein C9374_005172 [Naegleria lovaniensis]KAG2382592.1 hypothetical protein C9374_005172 [Naegleria lovaniensis]
MKRNSVASASSQANSPAAKNKRPSVGDSTSSRKEEIEVFLLTRSLDDRRDDSVVENWDRIDFRIIPTESTPTHTSMVCHVEAFNDETVESVRLGILVENNSNMDIIVAFEVDSVEVAGMAIVVLKGKSRIAANVRHDGYLQPIIIRKNKLAEDYSEVIPKEELGKIGCIKATIYRANKDKTVADTQPKQGSGTPLENKAIKIKESMSKDGALSMGFGERKPIIVQPGSTCTKYNRCEKIKTWNVKYRNKIGFLWTLVQNGITMEEAKAQQEENEARGIGAKEQGVIEISDEEESDANETATPIIPKVAPIKSQTIMEKVKGVSKLTVEQKNVDELLSFIKSIDENLFNNVRATFKKEHIDGVAFLSLTHNDLKDMKVSIGDMIKVKQILQQLAENQ